MEWLIVVQIREHVHLLVALAIKNVTVMDQHSQNLHNLYSAPEVLRQEAQ